MASFNCHLDNQESLGRASQWGTGLAWGHDCGGFCLNVSDLMWEDLINCSLGRVVRFKWEQTRKQVPWIVVNLTQPRVTLGGGASTEKWHREERPVSCLWEVVLTGGYEGAQTTVGNTIPRHIDLCKKASQWAGIFIVSASTPDRVPVIPSFRDEK